MFEKKINKLNIAQIFFLLFLASLFFPIRYVFPTKEAFQTGAYSDFTSISLYLSDIFLILTTLFILPLKSSKLSQEDLKIANLGLPIFLIWLILGIIFKLRTNSSLNYWFLLKYLELAVSYGTAYYLFSKTTIKGLFLKSFVFFATFESILALWQFFNQKSLGLGKIGEQVLSPHLQGIAKIVSDGTAYIRGYGTFPHPNLLSAFLVVGVFFSIYLLINSKNKLLYNLAILINTLGLTVTFSRAAYLALAIGLVMFFYYTLVIARSASDEAISHQKKIASVALAMTAMAILASFILFHPYLSTRATISDSASLERIFYAKLGLQMIKENPVFGIGIGESVLHMQQFSYLRLWPWQIQPIHNYFLLAAAELGIPGALILISIFLSHLWGLVKKLKSPISFELTTYYLLFTTILCAFLVLMQFDHYFYTLQQTQMLLWVILGIIAAETKNPQGGD